MPRGPRCSRTPPSVCRWCTGAEDGRLPRSHPVPGLEQSGAVWSRLEVEPISERILYPWNVSPFFLSLKHFIAGVRCSRVSAAICGWRFGAVLWGSVSCAELCGAAALVGAGITQQSRVGSSRWEFSSAARRSSSNSWTWRNSFSLRALLLCLVLVCFCL